MTNEQYAKDLQARYDWEIAAGGRIRIGYGFPTVAIARADGHEFWFQGDEAAELIDSVPDFVKEEVFLLAMAQGW